MGWTKPDFAMSTVKYWKARRIILAFPGNIMWEYATRPGHPDLV